MFGYKIRFSDIIRSNDTWADKNEIQEWNVLNGSIIVAPFDTSRIEYR